MLNLYNSLIHMDLEQSLQWYPTHKKDTDRLEREQAIAIKLVLTLRGKNHEGYLRDLNLFLLKTWRLCDQLIEAITFSSITMSPPCQIRKILYAILGY